MLRIVSDQKQAVQKDYDTRSSVQHKTHELILEEVVVVIVIDPRSRGPVAVVHLCPEATEVQWR